MTREEAIQVLKEYRTIVKYHLEAETPAFDMAIEALKQEPRIGEWIPCSERLPDVGRDVLFCDSKWTEEGCLRADGDWWQFRWSTVMPKEKVTAWMPLPKPYKESEVEE